MSTARRTVTACATDDARDAPARIRDSWVANATAWTRSVRGARIESRRVATDAAILGALRELAPRRLLDVGCGEGWLARATAGAGIETVGIDACAPLIDAASAAGGGCFHQLEYAALAADPLAFGRFDAAVCSFSLLERDLEPLLGAVHALLETPGTLLVQTVHPDARPDGGVADGWRLERFSPLGSGFRAQMPWYFRTLSSWHALLARAGFDPVLDTHVRHPLSGAPLSLILHAHRKR